MDVSYKRGGYTMTINGSSSAIPRPATAAETEELLGRLGCTRSTEELSSVRESIGSESELFKRDITFTAVRLPRRHTLGSRLSGAAHRTRRVAARVITREEELEKCSTLHEMRMVYSSHASERQKALLHVIGTAHYGCVSMGKEELDRCFTNLADKKSGLVHMDAQRKTIDLDLELRALLNTYKTRAASHLLRKATPRQNALIEVIQEGHDLSHVETRQNVLGVLALNETELTRAEAHLKSGNKSACLRLIRERASDYSYTKGRFVYERKELVRLSAARVVGSDDRANAWGVFRPIADTFGL